MLFRSGAQAGGGARAEPRDPPAEHAHGAAGGAVQTCQARQERRLAAAMEKLLSTSARRTSKLCSSVPKNAIFGDFAGIIKRLQLAFLVERVKSVGFIFNVVDEDFAVAVVNFVLKHPC